MFDRIFGEYLVKNEVITAKQLEIAYMLEESAYAKLGVIAASEGLITVEQANEVNQAQTVFDKKFGDIAIDKNFLTQEQVDRLLKLQGNLYLVFVQALIDSDALTLEQSQEYLLKYQKENGFTATEIMTLKSGDMDKINPILLSIKEEICQKLVDVMIRTIYRFIDRHVYILTCKRVSHIQVPNIGYQVQIGDFNIFTAITGADECIIQMGKLFAGEIFVDSKDEALDAVSELNNIVNGLFATECSLEKIDMDMLPPEYYGTSKTIKGEKIYDISLKIDGHVMDYLIAFNTEYQII